MYFSWQEKYILFQVKLLTTKQLIIQKQIDMNNDELSVGQIIAENNCKLTATKIRQLLSQIRESPSSSAKRWVWELLQNAKDVPNRFGRVSIEIELKSNDILEFRHNGNAFTMNNVTGLVQQVSSKDSQNSEGQTGKFGTGFICTHLLSDIIDVSGVLFYRGVHRRFSLKLDRSGVSAEELMPRIKETLEYLENVEQNYEVVYEYEANRTENSFDTAFTYHLTTPEKRDAAVAGINDLINTLPITLVTQSDKIKQVRVINRLTGSDEVYECNSHYVDANVLRSEISINRKVAKTFVTYKTDELALTIEVENDESAYNLVKRDKESPALYRDFPLIGSEKFYFPYTLNGFNLNPTEKRNGIVLNSEDSPSACQNREIIDKAVDAVISFNEWLISHGASNRYLLASSRIPEAPEKYDERVAKPWIENLQKGWRQRLLPQELVEANSGFARLENLSLPIFQTSKEDREDFFRIVSENYIGRGVLPKSKNLHGWIEAIGPNTEFESWGAKLKYEIDDFLNDIQSKGCLSNLCAATGKSKSDIVSWLNRVYRFLADKKLTDKFDKYSILPNQNGVFKHLKELKSDFNKRIPSVLKDIYNEVMGDASSYIENELLDNDVDASVFNNAISVYGLNEMIASLNAFIKIKEGSNTTRSTVALRVIALYPNSCSESFSKRRAGMYEFTTAFRSMAERKSISVDNEELWKEADEYWFKHCAELIQSKEDIAGLSSLVRMSEGETLGWLNRLMAYYRENSHGDLLKEYAVFPNQKLEFKKLDGLHYDNGIDEEYKTLAEYISSETGTDDTYRPKLLHRAIRGYEQHNPLGLNDLYEEVFKAFEESNESRRNRIATQTIILLPQDKSDDSSFSQLYKFAKDLFGEQIPVQKLVAKSTGFKWEFARTFYINKISKTIAESVNVEKLMSILCMGDTSKDSVCKWVNRFIEFVYSFKQEYRSIITDKENGNGIWLNQKMEFCRFQDVRKDESIPEDLKNVALNKWVKIDYREKLFVDSSSIVAGYLETCLTVKDVAKDIDEKIEGYKGDKQDKEFADLIFKVRTLYDAPQSQLPEFMTYYKERKNELIVGSLSSGKTLDLVGSLVQAGEDKLEQLNAIIKAGFTPDELAIIATNKLADKEIAVRAADGEEVNISLSYTQYGGLSENEICSALLEAKMAVKAELERQGFEFTKEFRNEDYGNVYGVMKDGVEYPLVVHSYKWQNRPFSLTVFDWEQLARPNSMLWINTREGVQCIPFYELMKGKTINISFDASNFDYADRCKALARTLRYFKGLNFDFGLMHPNCSSKAEVFMKPEKPLDEVLGSDNADSMM